MRRDFAAVGGFLMPAAIYGAINWGDSQALRGWAIPAATDVAFAIGVCAPLGRAVPSSLKAFLLALAIIDDRPGRSVLILYISQADTSDTCAGLRRKGRYTSVIGRRGRCVRSQSRCAKLLSISRPLKPRCSPYLPRSYPRSSSFWLSRLLLPTNSPLDSANRKDDKGPDTSRRLTTQPSAQIDQQIGKMNFRPDCRL